jgi:hypothetical protein
VVVGPGLRRDDSRYVARLVSHASAFSRHLCPSLALRSAALNQRAQGKPGADRTHGSRVVKNAGGRTTGVTGNNPAFPARWVTAYFVLSPARLGLFVTAFATRTAQCDETPATWASGPHDFTVRFRHASSLVTSASTASHRNTPDDAQRPSIG